MSTIFLVTTTKRDYWTNYASPEEVLEYFRDHTHIGFDTETSGMSFMGSVLHSIQFGDLHRQYVVDLDGVDINIFAPLFKKVLVLQNAAFDLPFIYKKGFVPLVYDTLLAEKNLSLGMVTHSRGLDDLVLRYCGVALDKSKQKEIAKGLIDEEAITYAGLDVKYLLSIMEGQIAQATREQVVNAIQLDCRFVRVAAYMEYCGIGVDEDALTKLVRKNEAYEYMAEERLQKYMEEHHPDLYNPDFNWGSSQQVIELFKNFGIECFNKKTGNPTVDAKELAKLSKTELLDLYLDYSSRRKIVSTYGRNWFSYIWPDGRVHSKFNVLVDTGRTSSGDTKKGPFPNLQNFSRGGNLRKIFKAKGPNSIIACDYSGQESVVLADISGIPKMLEFYKRGSGDLHSYIAKAIFPEQLASVAEEDVASTFPQLRQLAKSATFAIAYGGTGYTISENLNIPRETGDAVYETYMKAFPELTDFFRKNLEDTIARKFVKINYVTGRKRKFDNIEEMLRNKQMLGYINRVSTNTKIQGTSADISKTAAVLFFEWLVENKLFGKVMIINFVHDELVIECHTSLAEKIAAILSEKMELAGSYFLKTLTLKAEAKIGKQWAK